MRVVTEGPEVECRECGEKVLKDQERYLFYVCDQPYCWHKKCAEDAARKAKEREE